MASNTFQPITRKQVLGVIALVVLIIALGFVVDTMLDPQILNPYVESTP